MQTMSTLRVAFELLSLISERYVLQFFVASVLYYSNAEHVYSNTNVLSICVCGGGEGDARINRSSRQLVEIDFSV